MLKFRIYFVHKMFRLKQHFASTNNTRDCLYIYNLWSEGRVNNIVSELFVFFIINVKVLLCYILTTKPLNRYWWKLIFPCKISLVSIYEYQFLHYSINFLFNIFWAPDNIDKIIAQANETQHPIRYFVTISHKYSDSWLKIFQATNVTMCTM